MIVITERAGELLKIILEQAHAKEDQCVRLDLSSLRTGLRVDRPQLGDELVTYQGRKLLVVDPYTAENIAQQTLDFDQMRFVLLRRGF